MRTRITATANRRALRQIEDLYRLDQRELKDIAASVDTVHRRFMGQQFTSEGASGGARWAPLSPLYAAWKKRRFPGRKILARTGRGRKSLTQARHPEHLLKWYLRPRAVVEVGTQVPYMAYHAGYRSSGSLPVRDPIQLTESQRGEFTRVIREHLKTKLARISRVFAAVRAVRTGTR